MESSSPPRGITSASEDDQSEGEGTGDAVSNQFQKAGPSSGDVLKLAYQSLGVIYGDMGTSPLYVFSNTFEIPPHSKKDIVGSVSLIFWSITIIGLIKYVMIVLSADDNGEGRVTFQL
ncbi:hypothetical protein Mapa_001551 [Marchantia paleacea]|nr:hypothetical protein Mapa_001551 [Marchantia paleacea]